MSELRKNDIVTLTVEDYTGEGLGVARLEGRVIFVRRGVRGETCEARVEKVLKNTAYAKVVSVAEPSPHRREPDCPYYGRCGGCDYRHMDYAEELFAKKRKVQSALTRLGGSDVEVEEILAAASPTRYRNKAQYPISKDGAVGFYRAHSHDVTDIPACLLQTPQAEQAAETLRQWMRRYAVPGYDESAGRGLLRHLYVRCSAKGESLVCILCNGEKLPHERELTESLRAALPGLRGVVLGVNRRRDNVILADRYRTLWGEGFLEDTLCGLTFRLSVPSFYQVNRAQAEVLYGKALEFAGLTGTETVLDLYCGAGTITLVMAKEAGRVIGAEIVPEAIRDAEENRVRNAVENAEFFCGDAGAVAAKLAAEGLRPDVITVDPPRKGLAEDVVESIVRMEPGKVVYVSCDPATLGRDVRRFADFGYVARRAAAVDLFPGTQHVETVVMLTKI
ncbi:MAG: 23S rRNA (uracil(1939)-C(5))-methyltransferase RlmD [Oscillospiraceae bacterium]